MSQKPTPTIMLIYTWYVESTPNYVVLHTNGPTQHPYPSSPYPPLPTSHTPQHNSPSTIKP